MVSIEPSASRSPPVPRAPRAPVQQGYVSLLLTPLMVVAFALLHIAYQIVLLARQVGAAASAARRRGSGRTAASFASLDELVAEHDGARAALRVPAHMAVILAEPTPSSFRLWLSSVWMRLRPESDRAEAWQSFRAAHSEAVEAKQVEDMATLIHLAAISGVQQLSLYTYEPLSPAAVHALTRRLVLAYKTRALVHPDPHQTDVGACTAYSELRRRTPPQEKSSEAGSASAPGSSASSDSDALSSLDETLASSYTLDTPCSPDTTATVHIQLGLCSARSSLGSTSRLRVVLLSRDDGQVQFARAASVHLRQLARRYLSSVLVRDVSAAGRVSGSRLRRAWVGERRRFVAQLDVKSFDAALHQAGYLDDPELVVVRSATPRLRSLHGFPAWPIRIADLFYDPHLEPHAAYAPHHFVAALAKLATAEQRYGK